jgi:N-dimethylarginine dimethylaminohydrolase
MSWPKTLLMVDPEYFDVQYSINPHMLDQNGQLNKIDRVLAKKQWLNLKSTFEKTGIKVLVLEGAEHLPDMVFCANQTFPFLKNGKKSIVLSKMGSEQRQPEVKFFKTWALENHIDTFEIQSQLFEGMGDALWNYDKQSIFAGYGFRTGPETYSELEKILDQKIITLELIDPRFYHLDTCLALLNSDTAAYVKEAFTNEGLDTLKNNIKNLIQVPLSEALKQLACNMCTTNGRDIIIQQGAKDTVLKLKEHGFKIHEVDTSEYIKSGGSVFCMKQMLF